ncbi:hypothetical protein SLEP1_g50435 [Rubroshorea leprosula]|uniref:Uncharacterized protein n=1 Tax=Rubroshorea leprosula TaxID=152421 RepID=A0AAV5M2C9_9ROSI|nr:hypothetical protein SLEP1_g50435 [Rubroshorea leprosula]
MMSSCRQGKDMVLGWLQGQRRSRGRDARPVQGVRLMQGREAGTGVQGQREFEAQGRKEQSAGLV